MNDSGPVWLSVILAAIIAWMVSRIRSAGKSAESERPATIQTNPRQGSELAERILGDYVFNWGQSREVKINTLNRALKAAEIKCQVYVDEENGPMLYDAETPDEMKRAYQFQV